MNTHSIRFRLVVWYAGVLVTVFLLLGASMYKGLEVHLVRSLGQVQMRRAKQIAESLLANVDQTGETHVVSEINSWFGPEANDRFIRITHRDGSVVFVSGEPRDGSFIPSKIPMAGQRDSTMSLRREKVAPDNELLIASDSYVTPHKMSYLVEVGESLQPAHETLRRLIFLLAVTLAGGLAVAIAGGYFLVGRALAPVDKISSGAEQITLRRLEDRLPVAKTGDELERLAVSLNRMIERLENALEHDHRFIADASHELRTPLTIIRGELEEIVAQTGAHPQWQRTSASVLEEVERLAHIVEGLFAISRLDAGEAQKEWLAFDLAELASSTAEQMLLLAEDKDISVMTHTSQPVMVKGDRARMKQVVVNLLDNAIKYTSRGGTIQLTVAGSHGRAGLEVADNGIGIPDEAKPHIFERFFRVEKARSREQGGAGLGLSIVKSICVAHGGEVTFQSAEGSGSKFTIELPLANDAGFKKDSPRKLV